MAEIALEIEVSILRSGMRTVIEVLPRRQRPLPHHSPGSPSWAAHVRFKGWLLSSRFLGDAGMQEYTSAAAGKATH